MFDFACRRCGCELHLAAAFDKREVADRALDLLGWTRNSCRDCNEKIGQDTGLGV